MIEIKSAAPDTANALCPRADTVLEMLERDERLGYACMRYENGDVQLMELQAPDAALTDALLRAALNTARAAGAKHALIVDAALVRFMQKKSYFGKTGETSLEIALFFEKSVCKG